MLLGAASETVRTGDVILEARKQWPSGLDEPKGRIGPDRRALHGRALAQVGDAGWWEPVDAILSAWEERPVPSTLDDEVVNGVGRLLRRWGWPSGRPTWVTWIPSTRRPGLPETLARRLAEIGKLQLVGVLERTRSAPPQTEMGNSAHACANVWGSWQVTGPVPTGPVLVVDDTSSSGWTLTVIADLLCRAGAGPVYPVVLARC